MKHGAVRAAGGRGGSRPTVIVRLFIYILAAIVFFALRGKMGIKPLIDRAPESGAPDTTLVIGGADVAPLLLDRLVERYRLDYPHVGVTLLPGGTAQGLQDLVNDRAGATLLSRPPTPEEQDIFRGATGDSALWHPVAIGAALIVAAPDVADTVVTLATLRRLATEADPDRSFYVPDPNSGLWDAFCARLGVAAGRGNATFLADDAAVVAAVAAEPGALGLVSSLALRTGLSRSGARALAVQGDSTAVAADNVTLATGAYPLWIESYVAGRGAGDLQGGLFVTFVTGPRGQRQIEQTPYLPARLMSREIYLTRDPEAVP